MTSYQKRQARNAYEIYSKGKAKYFHDCYSCPSDAKVYVMREIFDDSHILNGDCPLVISYNIFMFTAGFTYPNPETGVLMFRYYTPSYTIDIEV